MTNHPPAGESAANQQTSDLQQCLNYSGKCTGVCLRCQAATFCLTLWIRHHTWPSSSSLEYINGPIPGSWQGAYLKNGRWQNVISWSEHTINQHPKLGTWTHCDQSKQLQKWDSDCDRDLDCEWDWTRGPAWGRVKGSRAIAVLIHLMPSLKETSNALVRCIRQAVGFDRDVPLLSINYVKLKIIFRD